MLKKSIKITLAVSSACLVAGAGSLAVAGSHLGVKAAVGNYEATFNSTSTWNNLPSGNSPFSDNTAAISADSPVKLTNTLANHDPVGCQFLVSSASGNWTAGGSSFFSLTLNQKVGGLVAKFYVSQLTSFSFNYAISSSTNVKCLRYLVNASGGYVGAGVDVPTSGTSVAVSSGIDSSVVCLFLYFAPMSSVETAEIPNSTLTISSLTLGWSC